MQTNGKAVLTRLLDHLIAGGADRADMLAALYTVLAEREAAGDRHSCAQQVAAAVCDVLIFALPQQDVPGRDTDEGPFSGPSFVLLLDLAVARLAAADTLAALAHDVPAALARDCYDERLRYWCFVLTERVEQHFKASKERVAVGHSDPPAVTAAWLKEMDQREDATAFAATASGAVYSCLYPRRIGRTPPW